MKLVFLGSGSAFTIGADNYQSNMLLEDEKGQRLLIDCGSDARQSLFEKGLSYRDVSGVYVSHLHVDHVGGLEWLAFSTFFDPGCDKPVLYISSRLVDDLWNKVLAGGLSSLPTMQADLSTYFKIVPVEDGGFFTWSDLKIKLIPTFHFFSNYDLMPSYGLWFTIHGQTLFITTDTQFVPEKMMKFYQQADLIFHDCETSEIPSGVHATYAELKTLDPAIKKKIWLYHQHPGHLPDAKKDGFKGFVQKGQIFEF